MDEIIISVFYDIDNFCKELFSEHILLPCDGKDASFELSSALSLSESMTICVAFHLSGCRKFKCYYSKFMKRLPALFAQSVSLPSPCIDISFVDSTTLDVCDSHRIWQNRVFKGVAQRGKSSTGWHYGFNLHLVINDRGEILRFCLTTANVDNLNQKIMKSLTKKLFEDLLDKGVELITKRKKNAKNLGMLRLQTGSCCRNKP